MNGKQYQVIAQVERGDRDDPLDLKSFFVRNNRGELIQLDNLVKMEEVANPPTIFHFNRFKSATVQAGLAPGKTIGDGITEMRRIANDVLDETFTTSLAGSSRDYAESSSNTSFAFMLALILIFLVLAAQFESFIDPLIIMITVPLGPGGSSVKHEVVWTDAEYIFPDRDHHVNWIGHEKWYTHCGVCQSEAAGRAAETFCRD
jgi:multidrug efflux pump